MKTMNRVAIEEIPLMETTLISVDEYLHTTYEPDMEYVDGVLVGRNAGTKLHGLLQTIVAIYLGQFRKAYRINVLTETRLLMKTGRYRIPDIMVLERPFREERVVREVPAVTIEIKSPDDTFDDVLDKSLEYAELGVPNIVVLDPDNERQYVFANRALQLSTITSLYLPSSNASLPFVVDDIFEQFNEDRGIPEG
jgi:Uma2 family endonuclease